MSKRVLITGGAGFLGSHFVNHVVAKYPQHQFVVIDKLNYASGYSTQLIKVKNLSNFKFIELDLSVELDKLEEIFQRYQITHIINFAAESCVDRSFDDPLYFTRNNIFATQNLLECCRISSLDIKFLHISTDEVYGEQELSGESVDEEFKLNPTNPYAATKASIDLIIQSYIYSYKLPITIIRSNNVYGFGQYPEKIVPLTIDILKKRMAGERHLKIPIHGDGHYKRTYLFITDFLNAVELIWLKQQSDELFGQVFNISGDNNDSYEMGNLELIKFISDCFHNQLGKLDGYKFEDCIKFVKDRNYNDSRYLLNCHKIKKLGWRPKVSLQIGIPKLIDECI